jgi:hypothetical protein
MYSTVFVLLGMAEIIRDHMVGKGWFSVNIEVKVHLIDPNHQLDSLENSLTILKFQQKGRMMNTIEQYHIYRITKTGNQLNEQFTEKQNPIFEAVLRIYPDK